MCGRGWKLSVLGPKFPSGCFHLTNKGSVHFFLVLLGLNEYEVKHKAFVTTAAILDLAYHTFQHLKENTI